MTVREVLETYNEISIDKEITEEIIIFTLYRRQFLIFPPSKDNPASTALLFLCNDDGADFPHIMLNNETLLDSPLIPKGKYRWVCLYEQESLVNSIVSYEDKISDSIERLIELLSMNEIEKEREFQKEFMLYWNANSVEKKPYSVYLTQEDEFAEMDVYFGESNVRIIEKGLYLSDINDRDNDKRKWVRHVENDVFFIPISDNRGIYPPRGGNNWASQEIKNIVFSQQVEHISDSVFKQINCTIPKTQNIILVFGMKSEWSNVTFAVKIKCKNNVRHSLLKKILYDIVAINPLTTERKDYLYFNEQLGNDIGLLKKKVLVVGAGSLGSYVAFELVKNGAAHLKLYDREMLEDDNILRWAYGGVGVGSNKAKIISTLLGLLHPEIEVIAEPKNIDERSLIEETSCSDLIIFTIGNSDEQLKFNRILKASQCAIPVIYTWLEAGGKYSHILYVNYQKKGCFECLYTNENGDLINNRARMNSDDIMDTAIIRNGCEGTRAAYGTTSLLRTTAALLDIIQKVQMNELTESVLVDVSPESVCISCTTFPMEACKCCGN